MQHIMRWSSTSVILSEHFPRSFEGFLITIFSVISVRPGMTGFVFWRFYNFILSLHSDLRFKLSFPSVFILMVSILIVPINSINLSGGEEPHNVIEDGHR